MAVAAARERECAKQHVAFFVAQIDGGTGWIRSKRGRPIECGLVRKAKAGSTQPRSHIDFVGQPNSIRNSVPNPPPNHCCPSLSPAPAPVPPTPAAAPPTRASWPLGTARPVRSMLAKRIRTIYSLRTRHPWGGVKLPLLIATCSVAVGAAVAIPLAWIEPIIGVTLTAVLALL